MKNCSEFKDAVPPDELDLPDWSASDHRPRRLSTNAAFQLCERYSSDMPEAMKRLRSARRRPCDVEFVL
jgi:hypothetical protein